MMLKRRLIVAGLLLLTVAAMGIASASEESFWAYYTQRYIEKFGEDKFLLVNTPLDGLTYNSDYIEMHGEDKYALVTTPVTGDTYLKNYLTMHGQDKYALVTTPLSPENDPANRWDEMHNAALARMPASTSWDERHKDVTSRLTPTFAWDY